MSDPQDAPRVFISYSHDSAGHRAWVRGLAEDLIARGVDVVLDQFDLGLGGDLAGFMTKGLTESQRVLLICTPEYVSKANAGSGGVGYERLIVSMEVVGNIETHKFVPLLRDNPERLTPDCIGPRVWTDFNDDASYQQNVEFLAADIHSLPLHQKPALGPAPTTAPAGGQNKPSVESSAVRTRVLLDPWFESTRMDSDALFQGFGGATLEASFGVRGDIRRVSPSALLGIARQSSKNITGWPFAGVLSDGNKKPLPTDEGLRARIEGELHRDYWQLRSNGDFFGRESWLEDARGAETTVFFDVRIRRVAELLAYCRRLLEHFELPDCPMVELSVVHRGFAGRQVRSGSDKLFVDGKFISNQDTISTTTTFEHPLSDQSLKTLVGDLVGPMLQCFGGFSPGSELVGPIVEQVIGGARAPGSPG